MENSNDIENNLDMATYIMLHRIYDLLTVIATKLNTDDTAKMVAYHDQGYLLGPLPSYLADEDNNE